MPDKPKRRATRKQPQKPQTPVALTPPPDEPTAFCEHVLALSNRRTEVSALVAGELTRLQPPPQRGTRPQPAPNSEVKRQATLKALQIWQSAGSALLEDLRSRPIVSDPGAQPSPESPQPEPAKLMRRLVVGLSKNAADISTIEAAQRRWHAAAKAAREGIRLRSNTAQEFLGRPLRPDAQLHLKLAHATFMLEGNSPRVRKELKDAAGQSPKSQGLKYWLARYEVMAGNYRAAHEAASPARDYPLIRNILMPMLEPESANAPWLSWPCNFYTYRYTLAENSELQGMQQTLAALSNNPELETTWTSFGIPLSAINQLKARPSIPGKPSPACYSGIKPILIWVGVNTPALLVTTKSVNAESSPTSPAAIRT